MHYKLTIKTPEEAVKATKDYLGAKKTDKFLKDFKDVSENWSKSKRLRSLYFYMGLAGVQGRGVIHGLYRHMFAS